MQGTGAELEAGLWDTSLLLAARLAVWAPLGRGTWAGRKSSPRPTGTTECTGEILGTCQLSLSNLPWIPPVR